MDTVICKEVVITTLKRRGSGIEHSPIRVITEVYEKDGTLIAEHDPSPETFAQIDLLHFARWVKQMEYDADKLDSRAVVKWLDSIENSIGAND
jgi:hypothetical protein